MRRLKRILCLVSAFLLCNMYAEKKIGDSIEGLDLLDYKGKKVQFGEITVFEWTNFECPYVKKHYESGNMQGLQKRFSDKVVWITINSSAPGKEGYLDDGAIEEELKMRGWSGKYFVKDSSGNIGRAFGAKTTPHIFIARDGKIVYRGAIDSIPSTKQKDLAKAENYIATVLEQIDSENFQPFETKPYGCSVKY